MTVPTRVEAAIERLLMATRSVSAGSRRWLLVGATVVFVLGSAFALTRLDIRLHDLNLVAVVVLVVVGVPAAAAATAVEYWYSARVVHHPINARHAISVTLTATAANLLPLPGGSLVRIHGLHQKGARVGAAFSATLGMGLVWVGVATVAGVVPLLFHEAFLAALAFFAGGIIVLIAGWAALRRATPDGDGWRWFIGAVAIEVVSVLVGTTRTLLALMAIGVSAGFGEALVLTISAALAAAIGIFPSGLAIRELIAAALAPLVGIEPAAGFLAASVVRVVDFAVYAVFAGVVAVTGWTPNTNDIGEDATSPPPSGAS